MSCELEKITGFHDGALPEAESRELEAHLLECPTCQPWLEAERAPSLGLRRLPQPELPFGLEQRARRRLRRPAGWLLWLSPLAAALVFALWVRGAAPFVAFELAFDHDKCFSRDPLPAKVWANEPLEAMAWFRQRGTDLPMIPGRVGELELVGARYCPLFSATFAPHLYYASREKQVSLFVVPHGVRFQRSYEAVARRKVVRLLTVSGVTVGIVAEHAEDAEAFASSFRTMLASAALDSTTR